MARDMDTGTLDTGNWAPVRKERDDYVLPVQGELPHELAGTLFRNGPNPQFDTPDAPGPPPCSMTTACPVPVSETKIGLRETLTMRSFSLVAIMRWLLRGLRWQGSVRTAR